METPTFHLGARAVGLFGLLGAAAAAVSPLVGSLTDRREARNIAGFMIAATIASFVIFALSGTSLIGIGIGILLMDICVQSGHISNQSRVFALLPQAQSRTQTAYMFFYFVGGALGSYIGNWSWGHYQWLGVCVSAILMLSIAFLRFLLPSAALRSPTLNG